MGHGLEDEERFLELLRQQHPFPGDFSFRVIHHNRPAAGESIIAAVAAETGLVPTNSPIDQRASSGGRYVSMSLVVAVERPEDVLRVYTVLARLESIVSYL